MNNGPREDDGFYKTTKFDAVLIGLILFFSIAYIISISYNRIHHTWEKREALIYQKHILIEQAPLEKDRIITVKDGQMTIEIKGARVRVAKSDCPQHICMDMGWIQYSGQTIVCVPNQVLIDIKSTSASLVDAVSY